MKLHLEIVGALLIILACVHVIFPKYFNWKAELQGLSLINRQMMYVHTLFIAIAVFFMGLLCVTSAQDLIETSLGKKITLGLGIFWGIRLVIQIFGYSNELWQGRRFETIVHVVFTLFWIYFTSIFFWVYIG
jgi:hypothetical protein